MNVKHQALLVASVAGLLAAGLVSGSTAQAHAGEGKVSCYGINKCKGTGDCGGKGHACAGKNECQGKGYVEVDSEETCLQIAGGSLTPVGE